VYGSRKETKEVGDNIWWTFRSRIKYRYFVSLLSNTGGMDGYCHRASVFAVNVNWNADNRKWNCNANRLDDNRWNAGNRAFSQLNVFSSLNVGSFLIPILSSSHRAFCQLLVAVHQAPCISWYQVLVFPMLAGITISINLRRLGSVLVAKSSGGGSLRCVS